MKRNNRERIADILDAIEKINKYTVKGRDHFEENELIQTWVVHHFQILGEAAYKITPDFRDRCSEIPCNKIAGMRHIIVHDYLAIDLNIIWNAVENELPSLKISLSQILEKS